ncbi:DNA repair protein RadC [Marinobacteraceae bacterium S3BR75-40.1]
MTTQAPVAAPLQPREKLLTHGPEHLDDAELLAIFLRTGMRGQPVLQMAHALIERFGGLKNLLGASPQRFCQEPGLGTAKYTQLAACLEMARRVMDRPLRRGDLLQSPDDTRRFLQTRLVARHQEVFAVLFLDNRHRVLSFEELFTGTIDGAAVYPREVVRRALDQNAAAVILAHNHPSGVAEPSDADVAITRRLKEALALVDVRVLDHMVVGSAEVVSLAERGLF